MLPRCPSLELSSREGHLSSKPTHTTSNSVRKFGQSASCAIFIIVAIMPKRLIDGYLLEH